MKEIHAGFIDGLTTEQISIFADPKFNAKQMYQLRNGFNSKLSIEQVKSYADPFLSPADMYSCRNCFSKGIQNPQLFDNVLARYKGMGIIEEQAAILAKAASNGVPISKLDVITKKNFSTEQIEFLIGNLQKNKKPEDKDTEISVNKWEKGER